MKCSPLLKVSGPTFKLSVLKKTHIWTQFNVNIPLNDAFLFRKKDDKIRKPPEFLFSVIRPPE